MSWVNEAGEKIPTPRKEAVSPCEDRRVITTVMLGLRKLGWSDLKISRHLRYSHVTVAERLQSVPSYLESKCA